MSQLSDEVSRIFGFTIREGRWESYLDRLDKEGEPTRKNMTLLLFTIAQEMERLESKTVSLESRIDRLEKTPKVDKPHAPKSA